jgi:hypothetical protein
VPYGFHWALVNVAKTCGYKALIDKFIKAERAEALKRINHAGLTINAKKRAWRSADLAA